MAVSSAAQTSGPTLFCRFSANERMSCSFLFLKMTLFGLTAKMFPLHCPGHLPGLGGVLSAGLQDTGVATCAPRGACPPDAWSSCSSTAQEKRSQKRIVTLQPGCQK